MRMLDAKNYRFVRRCLGSVNKKQVGTLIDANQR